MNPYLLVLIGVRLGFGLALFGACIICCITYCNPKMDSVQVGAAIGACATFCTAVYFTIGALDAQLWREDGDRTEREREPGEVHDGRFTPQ